MTTIKLSTIFQLKKAFSKKNKVDVLYISVILDIYRAVDFFISFIRNVQYFKDFFFWNCFVQNI